MFWKNIKKAFTLAELMVVLAIIWILSAWAMNIFTWAIAEARDSNRVTDLNTMKTALESYYIKHKVYPQPAMQTSENVWGYAKSESAIATCWVALDVNWNINSASASNKCGWDILIKEKKVEEIVCNYDFTLTDSAQNVITDWTADSDFTIDSSEMQILDSNVSVLWDIYEFNNLWDVCKNYVNELMKSCDDNTDNNWNDDFDCQNSIISDSDKMYYYYSKTWWEIENRVNFSSKTFSTDISNVRENIIWWKWTLTENSWIDSIYKEEPWKAFYGFMQDNWIDPKYKSAKYKDFWFWYYPYSVFRDWVWSNNSIQNAKTKIWWTAYQISATLEKQDEDWNYHPETLIIWNYKRPKNSDWKIKAWYPRSLFWNWTDVIVEWQVEWEKAKYVKKPNWTSNRWIPYPVEEIE